AKAKAQPIAPPSAPQPSSESGALRFPQLRTVNENKSFGQGPAIALSPTQPVPASPAPMAPAPLPVAPPPAAPSAGDFTFDFGFSNAPEAKSPAPSAGGDPIAALIN